MQGKWEPEELIAGWKTAKKTDDGTVVYQGTDTDVSTAVQATEGGGVRS